MQLFSSSSGEFQLEADRHELQSPSVRWPKRHGFPFTLSKHEKEGRGLQRNQSDAKSSFKCSFFLEPPASKVNKKHLYILFNSQVCCYDLYKGRKRATKLCYLIQSKASVTQIKSGLQCSDSRPQTCTGMDYNAPFEYCVCKDHRW